MKKSRRILSLTLALLMILSLAGTASAASYSWNDASGMHTLTTMMSTTRVEKTVMLTNSPVYLHAAHHSGTFNLNGTYSATCRQDSTVPTAYYGPFEAVLQREGLEFSLTNTRNYNDVISIPASYPSGQYVIVVDFWGKAGNCTLTHGGSALDSIDGVAPALELPLPIGNYTIDFAPEYCENMIRVEPAEDYIG